MAYEITADCIACGACADSCPADAIHEGDGRYDISKDACLDCGACVDTCPTNAIIEG